jgi:hypothetical protein
VEFMPRFAAGMIFVVDETTDPPVAAFAGSCGAYTRRDVFITAAHCIPANRTLIIALEGDNNGRLVRRCVKHPTTDIAVLVTDPPEPDPFASQVFHRPGNQVIIDGGDFICYGFPAEGSPENRPIGRTIRGNIQRYFNYNAPNGDQYFAMEMSCPAPAGLSGSMLAYLNRPDIPIGVVTTNYDSYVLLDRLEEVEKNGAIYREQISRVVSYGIAASLINEQTWLDERIAELIARSPDNR